MGTLNFILAKSNFTIIFPIMPRQLLAIEVLLCYLYFQIM